MIQVITFGHPLSDATKLYLNETYPRGWKLFQTFVHLKDPENVIRAVDGLTRKLVKSGCDLSGRTETMIVLPGMTTLAAVVLAVLNKALGHQPKVLYVLYVNREYRPLPELPEIDLQRVANDLGRRLRDPQFLAECQAPEPSDQVA